MTLECNFSSSQDFTPGYLYVQEYGCLESYGLIRKVECDFGYKVRWHLTLPPLLRLESGRHAVGCTRSLQGSSDTRRFEQVYSLRHPTNVNKYFGPTTSMTCLLYESLNCHRDLAVGGTESAAPRRTWLEGETIAHL
jgi:hypothetical protein